MNAPVKLAQLRVCPDCGLVSMLQPARPGYDMRCTRCAKTFRRARRYPMTWTLACAIAGLLFYATLVLSPFLVAILYGRVRSSSLTSGTGVMLDQGAWLLATIVMMTAVVLPFLKLAGIFTVFGALHLRRPPKWIVPLFRHLKTIDAWSMAEIYLLGFIVAYTRMQALAYVHIDSTVFALVGLVLSMITIDTTLDPESVWEQMRRKHLVAAPEDDVASGTHLIGCETCHQANHAAILVCARCRGSIHPRKPDSFSRTAALTLCAIIFYVPANLLPVMQVTKVKHTQSYTILQGVHDFVHAGMWPLALLVFVASIAVPLFKLLSLTFMLNETRRHLGGDLLTRTRLYRFIDFIGRWSMIDIFMMSILVGMMRFGELAQIRPGPGAIYFASVVILTMMAVASFDPRLMWDAARHHKSPT